MGVERGIQCKHMRTVELNDCFVKTRTAVLVAAGLRNWRKRPGPGIQYA